MLYTQQKHVMYMWFFKQMNVIAPPETFCATTKRCVSPPFKSVTGTTTVPQARTRARAVSCQYIVA